MVDPEDIDLEDLIGGGGAGGESVSGYDLDDIGRKLVAEGVIYLDERGKMLIKCPEYTYNNKICGCAVYPVPDPDGGTKMVCSGPMFYAGEHGANVDSKSPGSSCCYRPDRLEDVGDGGGGFFGD